MDGNSIKYKMKTYKNKHYINMANKLIDLGDNKVIYNNINELIEREYYSKYMYKPFKNLSIYEKEILNNYSKI
jgi:hypothetical protein